VIRVVLTVALATALLTASLPAVDSARADRTAARLDADFAHVRESAATLVDRDAPTRSDVSSARRVVTIHVPRSSWTTAAVDTVTMTGSDEGGERTTATLGYTLENGRQRRVRLDVPLRTPDGPLVFVGSGTHRLVLTLARGDDGPVVVARRGEE
jgi:hypothetical protein